MPNRLSTENSPYLLQHANNPVNWYPWGAAALEKSAREDKPIFLSVGYAACHWCHVMEKESFENPTTAELMNKYFVNIKVDREERPDIDSIYMQSVVAMTNQGGWPMSVFLFPDGKPFYGGTYFPPVRRYNMPSFPELLNTLARLWREDRKQLQESSDNITEYLLQQNFVKSSKKELPDKASLTEVTLTLSQAYDWEGGGWGQAPKFPQPMTIEFLLTRGSHGDDLALDMALHALDRMAKGGMYDVIGGGFSRYSVDNTWLVPHFEKMLYDNAQLALAYLHGYLITKNPAYRDICEATLEFVHREMTNTQGGFFSSLDADSEGVEGKYYLWDIEEIKSIIDNPLKLNIFTKAYSITEQGNFEGKNILQRQLGDGEIAEELNILVTEVSDNLAKSRPRLLSQRAQRVRPAVDDKVITSWNALMLIAFAEAGRYLEEPQYTNIAINNAEFILGNLYVEHRLHRSWRAGQAKYKAYLEDYASLVLSLLSLYQSDPDVRWYRHALELADEMLLLFSDKDDGFFDTGKDHESLIIRPKELQDNATPSGSALAAAAMLQISALGDRFHWRDTAEAMLSSIKEYMLRAPTAYAKWLSAVDFALGPAIEVALIGDLNSDSGRSLSQALWKAYHPEMIAALSSYPPHPDSPPLLSERNLLDGKPTAYVCHNQVCNMPVNTSRELIDQIASVRNG